MTDLPQHLVDRARTIVRASDFARGAVTLRLKKTPQATTLEAKGYEAWAMRLGSRTFKKPFASFHHRFWRWYWPARWKLLRGESLSADELAALLIWGRGLGKSSHVEWACIAEGALAEGVTDEPGLVGYVCADSDLAKGHVESIRGRLESSEVAHFYPGLVNPRVSRGVQTAWRQDRLVTASGWGIIPLGLKEGVRGSRLDDMRFSMFVFDDVDNRRFSLEVIRRNLDIIAHEILPAGTSQTLKLFPQNLVRADGVLSQILSYESDVLADRVVIGTEDGQPQPSFDEVELVPDLRRPGVHRISSAVATWEGLDLNAARVFLSDSGRGAFLAEYQHEMDADRSEFVLPHWRDEVHVITESEFASVYGTKEIPATWNKYGIHDWARTKSRKHANVAGFVTVASENTPKPGLNFLYGCMSFKAATEPDDVALRMLKAISPTVTVGAAQYKWDELINARLTREGLERFVADVTQLIHERRAAVARFVPGLVFPILSAHRFIGFYMSHERPDITNIYRTCYGLPFVGVNPGKNGGVEWLNSLMVVDRTRPHHFKKDELDKDGLYKLGASSFFLVVPDERAAKPRASSSVSLHDSDLTRFQLSHWRNVPEKVTELGAIERGPEKADDDIGNALMMLYHQGIPQAARLNYEEKLRVVSPRLQGLDEKVSRDGGLTPAEEMSYWFLRAEAKKRIRGDGPQAFDEWNQPVEDGDGPYGW